MNRDVIYDRYFWVLLSWYGFDLLPPHHKKWVRYLKKFVNMCFFLSALSVAVQTPIMGVYNFYHVRKVIEMIPSFIQSSCAIALCLSVHARNFPIRELLRRLKSYRARDTSKKKISPFIFYLLALVVNIVLLAVHDTVAFPDFVMLIDLLVSHKITHNVFLFFSAFLYYAMYYYVPTVVGAIYCVICKHIIDVLSLFETKLECVSRERDFDLLTLDSYVKEYSCFIKIVTDFNDVFSTPMLLATAMYFSSMFRVLASILIPGSFTSYEWIVGEIVNTLVMNAFMTSAICNKASQISTKMGSIKSMFSRIYERILFSKSENDGYLFLTQHVISKEKIQYAMSIETVVLSAGNVLFFSMKFLGIAFGTLITYGILFIQIQDKWSVNPKN